VTDDTGDQGAPAERADSGAAVDGDGGATAGTDGGPAGGDEVASRQGTAAEPPVHDRSGGEALVGGLLTRELLAKTLVGFGVAAVLLYLLGVAAGWGDILAALSGARLRWLAVGCLSTFLGLSAWGKAWQVVLRVVGVEESYRRLVVTYFAATFANYVTPLGQAGGEPFIAYVLSSDTDASYQDSLASVVTADLLNLLPFFNFAAVGLAWLLLQASLPENAETLAQGLVLLAVGVPGVVYVGWRHREGVEAAVLALVDPVASRTARVSVEGVRGRIDEFYAALERIADEPRALVYALVFAYVGWVFFALPLYFGALTLGYGDSVGVLLILFIVPASTLAGLVPTPGGSGAVEGALGVLLIALAGLSEAQAGALAIVYRVASYYFAIAVGGLSALWVVRRT
jgi:uncharacterized protein (TIRG00374 family)